MGLFSKGKTEPTSEQFFECLMARTVAVIEELKTSTFRVADAQPFFDETLDVGTGWTALANANLFLEVSEPYDQRLLFARR